MEIFHHFSHQHPLVFYSADDAQSFAELDRCFGCDQTLEDGGSRYGCKECKYYLHQDCAELELSPHLDHPFHPQHPLTLFPRSPYDMDSFICNFCGCTSSSGFVYHCDVCSFDLHVNCALLQSSIAPNSPNSIHPHPLFFLPDHNHQVQCDCSGCKKPLSGPIYHCPDCSYESNFNLHKECAELPLEINHPYDRTHPLTLLPKMPTHPEKCGCDLCKIQWDGFVYSCSLCNFDLSPEDVSAPRSITDANHQHPWTLLSRQMSFNCDFCGTTGDSTPYLCVTCDLLVHKNCIPLPCKIMITRHQHIISHSYSLRRDHLEERICRICYREVETRYGCYYCPHTDCNYVAHVYCATDQSIWDGTIIPEDCDERSMEPDSLNLIMNIFEEMCIEEQMVAVEIKHAFHDHNLRLTFSGEIKDDNQCDGCMRSISTPFYSCGQCKFFLHKDCAELPRETRYPFHKHLLTLTNSNVEGSFSRCCVCQRPHNGFRYKCNKKENWKSSFECDIRCILLSDTLKHPSHEHSLFLSHNFSSNCSGCLCQKYEVAYRCMKHCDFILDIKCATKALTTWFKYDKHPLALTYVDDPNLSQHYCDLCEEERDPKDWFYHCADCDNSLHSKCAPGGRLQFMKLGSKIRSSYHQHPLIVVKNIWNCPPCKVCSNVCNGPAVECKESECNFTVHWKCRLDLD